MKRVSTLVVVLGVFVITATAQTPLINITSQTRYEFIITNSSDYNLEVEVAPPASPFYLSPKAKRTLPLTSKIKKNPKLKVTYPVQSFKKDTMTAGKEIRREFEFKDLWGEIAETIEGMNWEQQEEVFTQYVLSPRVVSRYKKIHDCTKLYLASSGKEVNEWSTSIGDITFGDKIDTKTNVTPRFMFSYGIPMYRKSLNNLFKRKSTRYSYDLRLSIRPLPDLRMGKGDGFLSLNLFGAYERLDYGWEPLDGSTILVGGSYLNTDNSNLVALGSQQGINIFDRVFSAGAQLQLLSARGVFLDLGVGYVVNRNIQVDFDDRNLETPYFSNGEQFLDPRISDIATSEAIPYYGIVRFGSVSAEGNSSLGMSKLFGFFYSVNFKVFPKSAINPTEANQFYYTSSSIPTPTFVPLDGGAEGSFGFQIDITGGVAF